MSDTKINRPALSPAPAPTAAKGNAPTNTSKETGTAASAKKPAGSTSTASTGSTKASAARAADGFESTGKASRPGVAAAQSLSAVTTAAAPGQPVKKTMTFVYDAGPHSELTDVKMKGSWDAQGRFSNQWDAGSIPMRSLGNGKWEATVELQDDGLPRNWEWGVTVDGPSGNDQWAVMGEGNLKLDLSKPTAAYAPTTYHEMGSQKRGEDISFKLWAPDARAVQVKVTDQQGNVQRIPMQKAENGDWAADVKGGWKQLEGKSYVYEVVDSAGATSDRPDPYARRMMGEQRGIDRMYVDTVKGREENRYFPGATALTRFTIDDEANAAGAYLVLKDADGKQLNREQLLARLGAGDAGLVDKVRGGKFNDLWSKNVEADGRIKMTNQDGAWTALVNDPEKLVGLRYEFQVMENDGKGGLRLAGRHEPGRRVQRGGAPGLGLQ